LKIESNPLDLAVHKADDDICSVFIVCDLDPSYLSSTLEFLNSLKSLSKTFSVVSIEDFLSWGLDFNLSAEVLCLHLSLDNEIKNHKLISDHAFKLGLKQLNPYNSLAELCDNKFLFYNFMLAQGFKQARTCYLEKNCSKTEIYSILDNLTASSMDSFLIKPCSGTESIDQYAFKLKGFSLKLDSIIEKITMIQRYDSLIIQEKLEFKEEYKIVFLYDSIFSAKALSEKILAFCLQLLAAFKDYARLKSEFMSDVFSIDLLELASEDLVILEANARPAGIFKCVKHSYYLGGF
jgi:hypothetical protein